MSPLAGWLIKLLAPELDNYVEVGTEVEEAVLAVLRKHGLFVPGYDLRRVDHWQAGLNELGSSPPLVVDGQYGPQLGRRLVDFQRQHGLPPTGEPNGVTIAALGAALKAAGKTVGWMP